MYIEETGEKRQKSREREKQGRKKKVKLTYSAEHREFNTFIYVGFSTFLRPRLRPGILFFGCNFEDSFVKNLYLYIVTNYCNLIY